MEPLKDLVLGLRDRVREANISISAAAVAYNAFLALVPLALALLGFAAIIGEDEEAVDGVRDALEPIAPDTVIDFIVDLMVEADRRVGSGEVWLILVSVVVALFLGSRAVVAMQKALASVENRTEQRPTVQMRLVAIALTAGGGVALLATSFLLVLGRRSVEFLSEWTGFTALDTLWVWLRVPASAAGVYLFLLAFYQWGPPRPLPKSWLAAIVATGLALLASLGFGIYLSTAPDLGPTFGALGAVAVALVWLYLVAFAILLGAVVVAYSLRWRSARLG